MQKTKQSSQGWRHRKRRWGGLEEDLQIFSPFERSDFLYLPHSQHNFGSQGIIGLKNHRFVIFTKSEVYCNTIRILSVTVSKKNLLGHCRIVSSKTLCFCVLNFLDDCFWQLDKSIDFFPSCKSHHISHLLLLCTSSTRADIQFLLECSGVSYKTNLKLVSS